MVVFLCHLDWANIILSSETTEIAPKQKEMLYETIEIVPK